MKTSSFVGPLLAFFGVFLVCTLLAALPSCGGIDCKDPKNVSSIKCLPADVISCAAAEAKAATDGKDVIAIGLEIAGKLEKAYADAKATGGDVTSAIEAVVLGLISDHGASIVACVLKDQLPPASATPVTGQADPYVVAIKASLAKHAWKFAGASTP